MEGKLHVGRLIGLRHSDLCQTRLDTAGALSHVILGVPDGRPSLAAVGRGLHGEGHLAVIQRRAGEAVVEGQGSGLAGEIHHRGDQQLVLLVARLGLIVVVGIHNGLLIIGTRRYEGVAGLMPVVILPVAVGVLHRPALAGEGSVVKVVVEDSDLPTGLCLLEGGGDGVIRTHTLEGVVGDGAQIGAVHHHIGHLVARGRYHVKGLAGPLLHQSGTGGVDSTALTGGSRHGDIVLTDIGVQLDIIHGDLGAALTGVDKGEAQVVAILELFGDGDLGLRGSPSGKGPGILLQVPDLLPGLTVGRSHDLQVAALVVHGIDRGGVEVEDHVDIRLHTTDVGGTGIQPLVLLEVIVGIHGGGVVHVTIPRVDGSTFGLHAPIGRQPIVVEGLGPQHIGGLHNAIIVAVAGHLHGVALGVAGVVVNDHAEGLTHTGDVILLDVGGEARRGLGEALDPVQQIAVAEIIEHDGRDILVIADIQAQIVAALGLGDLQVAGMGVLIIDGDGEGPAVLQVLGAAVAIGQGSLDGHGSLGVVGQLGVVLGGTVPCVDTGIIGIHTGGHDAVVVVAVDGLIDVVAGFFQIHLVGFLIGDGVLQRLGIAQQAGVDAGEAVHHVIAVVGGNGVVIGKIGHIGVVVVAQIGVDLALGRGGEGGVHVGLRLALGAVQRLPVIGGIDDGSLGPVAVEGQIGDTQINGSLQLAAVSGHLLQGHEALHIGAVLEVLQLLLGVGEGHGDSDLLLAACGDRHTVILAAGGEGVAQRHSRLTAGEEGLVVAVGIGRGPVGEDDGLDVVVQGVLTGVVDLEGHGVDALLCGIVAQFQLGPDHAVHGEVALGLDGVIDVDETCALLAGRIGLAVGIVNDAGGAHQQGIDHVLALGGIGHATGLQGLLHDGHSACRMGGGHGRAVHALIGVAGYGGIDACAGRSDLRLQGQLRSSAPGGEVRHTIGGGSHQLVGGAHGQDLVLLRLQILTGLLRDKRTGHLPVGDGHIQHTGYVVVHQHGDGAMCIGAALLLLIVHTAAALHQRHLAGDVDALIVVLRAVSGHHGILQLALLGQFPEDLGVLVGADGAAVLIGEVTAAHGDVGALDLAVGHGSHGHGLTVGGRLADQAVVGVAGQRLVAEGIAVSSAVSVTGSHSQRHTALAGPLKDVQQALGELVGILIVDVAGVGAEAQVGHIHAQQHTILQSGQDVGVGSAAAGVKDVHVGDLGVWGHTLHVRIDAGAAGGSGGHMGAVAALGAGGAVGVLIAIIELEGEFGALIDGRNAEALHKALGLEVVLGQQTLHVILRQGGVGGGLAEDLVVHVHAGIQNGDQHPLAGEARLVGQTAADHPGAVGGVRQQAEGRGQEHGLYAVQLLQSLILAVGHSGGEAVEQRRILTLRLHRLPDGTGHGGRSLLLLLQQGLHLGLSRRLGHGVVHHHNDLHRVTVLMGGLSLHAQGLVFGLCAPQQLGGDIVGNVLHRSLLHGGVHHVGVLRGRKGGVRQGRHQQYQCQQPCTDPFADCHLS